MRSASYDLTIDDCRAWESMETTAALPLQGPEVLKVLAFSADVAQLSLIPEENKGD